MASRRIEELGDAARLQLLVGGVVDYAIYMISLEGLVASWNPGAQRIKGYTAAEIIGQPYATFFTPEDRERGLPQTALQTAARDGRFEIEGWRVRKDGSRFWALAVVDAIRDESGELIGFAKITRDMTDREQARLRLLESETRFRRLVDAVVDYAIFQLDAKGNIVTWNPGAQRIKGYGAQEIIGQHFSRFYTEDDRKAGLPEKVLQTAALEGRYEAEGWRVRKDGSRFWALVVVDPIRDEGGNLLGFAKVTRDMTEPREAQRLLRETQEQLAASQKMDAVGQLSGGIAHDFNNLLMIVLGNLESAQRHAKGATNPSLERAIANAMRGAHRAAALTSRLLAFSRRQPLDPKILDVNRFLAGAADFLQRSLGETIEVEPVGGAGLWRIEADPNHLEAALVNLAINARDAMPAGGKVTIEATNVFADEEYCRINPELTSGQYVLICVSDTGCGMTPDVLSRAFEPFFTTKEVGQGTGLGLSQVYGFIKQSGGHIKIYSELGQGTTVKIYLPRYSGDLVQADEQHEGHAAQARGEQGQCILVVEDDNDLRAYLSEVLRGLGYEVVAAAHAQAALSILEAGLRRIDLLLTDVVMPGMNGAELVRRAHATRPDMRVLYMSGYPRNAVARQGRMGEGADLLQKPISQTHLAARIRDLLEQSAAPA